jgi:DNA end-binding protein Ku
MEEIDPRYFERPYYIVPADDQAKEGYLVIREALAKMKKAGLAQITMSGREHLAAVSPIDQGLIMEVIRYSNELKSTQPFFHDLTGVKLDPVRDLVQKKAKGKRVVTAPEGKAQPTNVINLMDALRKSVGAKGAKAAPSRIKAKRPKAS